MDLKLLDENFHVRLFPFPCNCISYEWRSDCKIDLHFVFVSDVISKERMIFFSFVIVLNSTSVVRDVENNCLLNKPSKI
jgi:hypothetical protein